MPSMDDVKMVWDKMSEKSWDGLKQATEGMDPQAADMIKDTADKMKDQPFPDSPEGLYSMMKGEGAEEGENGEDNEE